MTIEPPTFSPDQLAAHDLLSELRTRISTQPLPYQYGVEARALESLWEIFALARKAMKDHPGCGEFARVTTTMLNVDLRPVTAKWHRALKAGVLDSRDGANDFRADLAAVRRRLVSFAERLQMMAYGEVVPDEVTPEVLGPNEIARCFRPLRLGLDETMRCAKRINIDEKAEVAARRRRVGITKDPDIDAVGLALSGGGIRSATFCLGVMQVLAKRKLMKYFDFLSTVSGGGYTGSFISSRIGGGAGFEEIASPFGPDTEAIRHVRQNAKYLSAVDLKQRWLMVTGTLAGMIMNWMAPLFVLAAAAWLSGKMTAQLRPEFWLTATGVLTSITAVLIIMYGFALRAGAGVRTGSVLLACSAGAALACAAAFFIEWGYLKFDAFLAAPWPVTGTAALSVVAGPAVARFLPVFKSPKYRKLLLQATLIAAGIVVPMIALASFYLLRELGRMDADLHAAWWSPLHHWTGEEVLIGIAGLSGVFSLFGLNINLTGPHKLYRDQLAKTFVQKQPGEADLYLVALNGSGDAPYHLVNATVNLPASTSAVLRDRKGDFFVFSKHWTGSAAAGYSRTKEWWANGRPVDLATAMAISGAAASPQMGLVSMPALSALMTLLNVRLGYWIRNPTTKEMTFGPPGFLCLLREMTGLGMTETSAWLNVSDGGHIENIGMYELLRRRCKFIVCVDGEADPESTFHGQLTLVRHAQIDLGIRIEPRLDDMRLDPKSLMSRTHAQLFRIRYPKTSDGRDEGIGLLLYFKLSLTGDEAELLKRYRLVHPDFPHQSTLDQFYDEEQFEAYRQLGVHVAEGMFSPALMTRDPDPIDVEDWFRQLAANMLEPATN
jgi:hypothetical protein